MTKSLIAASRKYMNAWLKASSCTYPECQCSKIHELVAEIKELALCVGHDFSPEKHKISLSDHCVGG